MGIEDGVSLYLHASEDIISECIRKFKSWESTETRFVLDSVKAGQVVIDLGANLGYFTTIFSKLVGPMGRVLAVEPNDENFALLKRNLQLNGAENVQTLKAIASDQAGLGILYEHVASNLGAHTAISTDNADFQVKTLHPKFTLDHLVGLGMDRVDFIKMDTQSSEPLIVKGGRQLLKANSRHLQMVVEFSPADIQDVIGAHPREFYRQIIDLGFAGYFIDVRDSSISPVTAIDELIARVLSADGVTWPKSLYFVDLIFKPSL